MEIRVQGGQGRILLYPSKRLWLWLEGRGRNAELYWERKGPWGNTVQHEMWPGRLCHAAGSLQELLSWAIIKFSSPLTKVDVSGKEIPVFQFVPLCQSHKWQTSSALVLLVNLVCFVKVSSYIIVLCSYCSVCSVVIFIDHFAIEVLYNHFLLDFTFSSHFRKKGMRLYQIVYYCMLLQ